MAADRQPEPLTLTYKDSAFSRETNKFSTINFAFLR